ncbi:MAG: DUF2460 domain-containing protein [Armatimonadetes bacterium]|nr:DUF2460 domain-containing protein [Armatimonadota bacterium]
MAFVDIRLPEYIEREFSGGPRWSVTVVETGSGREQRNLESPVPRARWSAKLPISDEQERQEILAFWLSVRGPWKSFRFRDWMDYSAGMAWIINGSGAEELVHSDGDANPILPEVFGVSDGTTVTNYQLTKTCAFGSESFVRKITLPVDEISIWVETSVGSGVFTQRMTNYLVNYTDGTVVFTASAPTTGKKMRGPGCSTCLSRSRVGIPAFPRKPRPSVDLTFPFSRSPKWVRSSGDLPTILFPCDS